MSDWERLEEWCDGCDRSRSVRAYCEDWLGWRCDRLVGAVRHDTAATILWQATAEYCQAPTQERQMRLEKAFSLESPLETILIRMMGRVRPNGSPQSTLSLFLAQLWIARLASTCVAFANGQSQDVRSDCETVEYYAREAITELLRATGSELVCPEVDNFGDDLEDCESALQPVKVYLRRLGDALAAKPDAHRILAAMVQLESSVAWLLGLRAANQDSSSGRVLFVGEYADKQIGTLANLDVASYESTVQLESAPILVPDLVYQGLTGMDDAWNDHFQLAVEWAGECTKSKGSDNSGPHVALYRLDFAFGDKTNTKGGGNRSSLISGPSASLAAGVLCRSQWTGIDVDSRCGYIGAIGRESKAAQNGVPFGFVPVRGLFTKGDTFDRHDPIGTLIVGELSKDDAQAADRWEAFADAKDKDKVKQIDNLEQAFEIASGQVIALQVYAKTELNLVMRKLGAFMPKRLANVMNRSFGQTIETADFDVLDQMNMPQDATRPKPGAKARKPHAQVTPDEDEIAELQKVNLDAILLEFLNDSARSIEPRSSKCCKILGGPGMGKTWVGLRFHLRLLRNYFLATGNQGSQASLFPVWTTFHELQSVLTEHDDRSATEILGKIVSRRMHGYVASYTKFKDIADIERVIQQWIERHLENKTLVLFIDAWDERNQERKAEATVTDWLENWFVNNNPGIMTSRRLGESTISEDPMSPIQPHRHPWTLKTEKGELGFIDFARRWFGDDVDTYQERLEQIAESLELSEITSLPQVAAIVCWLLENGSLEIVPARRSELLMLAMERILAKNVDRPNDDPDHISFVKAVKQNIVLPMLQELAFNTFDSERWEFTLHKLRDQIASLAESGSCALRAISDVGLTPTSLAKGLVDSGLFTRTNGDRFEIVHQLFAETLVASHLVATVEFAEEMPLEAAEEKLVGIGFFDDRWANVFRGYIELLPDAMGLIYSIRNLVDATRCRLRERTYFQACRNLQVCLSYGTFQQRTTNDPWLQNYYKELLDGKRTEMSHQWSDCPYPSDVRGFKAIAVNLVSQGAIRKLSDSSIWTQGRWIEDILFSTDIFDATQEDAYQHIYRFLNIVDGDTTRAQIASELIVSLVSQFPSIPVEAFHVAIDASKLDSLRDAISSGIFYGIPEANCAEKFRIAWLAVLGGRRNLDLEANRKRNSTDDNGLTSICSFSESLLHATDLARKIHIETGESGPAQKCLQEFKLVVHWINDAHSTLYQHQAPAKPVNANEAALQKYAVQVVRECFDKLFFFDDDAETILNDCYYGIEDVFGDQSSLFSEEVWNVIVQKQKNRWSARSDLSQHESSHSDGGHSEQKVELNFEVTAIVVATTILTQANWISPIRIRFPVLASICDKAIRKLEKATEPVNLLKGKIFHIESVLATQAAMSKFGLPWSSMYGCSTYFEPVPPTGRRTPEFQWDSHVFYHFAPATKLLSGTRYFIEHPGPLPMATSENCIVKIDVEKVFQVPHLKWFFRRLRIRTAFNRLLRAALGVGGYQIPDQQTSKE